MPVGIEVRRSGFLGPRACNDGAKISIFKASEMEAKVALASTYHSIHAHRL